MISDLVNENLKETETVHSDNSRDNFGMDHNAVSSDFLAKSYKEMEAKEEILHEIERQRNLKVRIFIFIF